MLTRDRIRKLLEEDLGVNSELIRDDTPLFSSHLLSSFALITLVICLENEVGHLIDPADINMDNMDTVGRMVAFVGKCKGASSQLMQKRSAQS